MFPEGDILKHRVASYYQLNSGREERWILTWDSAGANFSRHFWKVWLGTSTAWKTKKNEALLLHIGSHSSVGRVGVGK